MHTDPRTIVKKRIKLLTKIVKKMNKNMDKMLKYSAKKKWRKMNLHFKGLVGYAQGASKASRQTEHLAKDLKMLGIALLRNLSQAKITPAQFNEAIRKDFLGTKMALVQAIENKKKELTAQLIMLKKMPKAKIIQMHKSKILHIPKAKAGVMRRKAA